MQGQLYRHYHIFALAELHSTGWIPLVRVKWLQKGNERQIDLKVTQSLTTRDKAEDDGLALGRSWVDEQIVQGQIGG